LIEAKIVPAVLLPHEAKQTQPFVTSKILQGCIYFAIRGKSTAGFILPLGGSDWLDWSSVQGRYTWISVMSL